MQPHKPMSSAPLPAINYGLIAAKARQLCDGGAALVIIFYEGKGASISLACEDLKLREKIPDMLRSIALEMDSETGAEFKHIGTIKGGGNPKA